MFRMLIHPFSGACDLFVELFYVLYCAGSMCVGVRCGSARVVWYPYAGFSLHKDVDVTCYFISLFNAQHVSDVNTSILGSLRLIC